MKNEAQFKTAFKKSVKAAHGFSLSLAAPMISGLPDLYVIIPGYMPVLLEAKWLGEIRAHNFNRKIPYRPLQKIWMKGACDVQEHAAMGLIGFERDNLKYCVLCENGMESINYGFQCTQPYCVYNKGFDVLSLFNSSKIPRLPLTSSKLCANLNTPLPQLRNATNDDYVAF